MGWLPVAAAAVTTYYFHQRSDAVLMWLVAGAGLISLCTFGIMHNFAIEAAKRRSSYRGGFSDLTGSEVDTVPDSIALVNMGAAIVIAALVVTAVVRSL